MGLNLILTAGAFLQPTLTIQLANVRHVVNAYICRWHWRSPPALPATVYSSWLTLRPSRKLDHQRAQ